MKKLLIGALALILMPLSALAIEYKEGEHYQVLNNVATTKPEVREFFSYFCPACFRFEPLIGELKQKLPANVKFEKNPVDFLPRNQPEAARILTKALIAAQLLKVEQAINNRIFQAIHVERKSHLTEADIQQFFLGEGIDAKKFQGAYNNFMVESQVQQMKVAQTKARITGVPSVIVNGKYKVTPNKDIKSADDYIALVNYLTTLN